MPLASENAWTAPMAMLNDSTGGRCDARVINQPEVAMRPIAQAALSAPLPATPTSRRGESRATFQLSRTALLVLLIPAPSRGRMPGIGRRDLWPPGDNVAACATSANLPPRRTTTRSAILATAGLCETTKALRPASARPRPSSAEASAVWSRCTVGSSSRNRLAAA